MTPQNNDNSTTTIYKNIEEYIDFIYKENPIVGIDKEIVKKNAVEYIDVISNRDGVNKLLMNQTEDNLSILYVNDSISMTATIDPYIEYIGKKVNVYTKSGIIFSSRVGGNEVILRSYRESTEGKTIYERKASIIVDDHNVIVTEIQPNTKIDYTLLFSTNNDFFKILSHQDVDIYVDSDGDGWPDVIENRNGTDPNDPNDHPTATTNVDYTEEDGICDDPGDPNFWEDGGFWVYGRGGIIIYINGKGEVVGWLNPNTGDYGGNLPFNPGEGGLPD
jgi:hypothetical protein